MNYEQGITEPLLLASYYFQRNHEGWERESVSTGMSFYSSWGRSF